MADSNVRAKHLASIETKLATYTVQEVYQEDPEKILELLGMALHAMDEAEKLIRETDKAYELAHPGKPV